MYFVTYCPVPSKASSAVWFQTLGYRMYLYRSRYKQAQDPDVALPWQHACKTNLLVFSEIHHLERSSTETGCCRWLNELFKGVCRAAPGDPGRGGQWDKSWWVDRDGTHKAATVMKHYWGSEVIEGQINKAAQNSLRKRLHRKPLTECDCTTKELSEVTDHVQESRGSGHKNLIILIEYGQSLRRCLVWLGNIWANWNENFKSWFHFTWIFKIPQIRI